MTSKAHNSKAPHKATSKRRQMQLARRRLTKSEHIDWVALQRAAVSPDLATSNDIANLQRTFGNQAVSRLLTGASPIRWVASRTRQPLIQAKPEVGPLGDEFQQVTDRAAAHKISAISSVGQQLVQRNGDGSSLKVDPKYIEGSGLLPEVYSGLSLADMKETEDRLRTRIWKAMNRLKDPSLLPEERRGLEDSLDAWYLHLRDISLLIQQEEVKSREAISVPSETATQENPEALGKQVASSFLSNHNEAGYEVTDEAGDDVTASLESEKSQIRSNMEAVANWVVDNSKTTPETGLPGAVTAYHDVSSVIDKLDQHVQGQGDQLIATAREEAVNPPDPDTAAKLTEGAQYATGIFDMLETLRSSYRGIKGWRARSEAKKKGELGEAEERKLGRSIKSAAGSFTIGFLNSAKFVGGLIDKLGGGIIGAIAGTASYIRSLRQMGKAEKAYLALRGVKVSSKYPDLQEAVRTARKKKRRKFGRKLASALTSGLGASLSIGQVVALATGGAAAAAALAVTPVGLVVGGVALAISLSLAGYAIWRKIHKRRLGKGKVEQRNRVADYLHAILARQKGGHYERKIARKVILALGLTLDECQGPAGRDNIYSKLAST